MKLTYDTETARFIAKCEFSERGAAKEAGFWWDNTLKSWATSEVRTAFKLREFADDQCKIRLNKYLIEVKTFSGAVTHSPGLTPYPYQLDAVRFALSRNRSLLALDAGLGKSIIAAMIAATSEKHVLFICPPFLKPTIEREFKTWCPRSNAVTVLPDTMLEKPLGERLLSTKPRDTILIVDECFAPETMVDTPTGAVRIDSIKPGDFVLNCTGVDRVSAVQKKRVNDILEITINGFVIRCTSNHKFLTPSGWKAASDLHEKESIIRTKDSLRIMRGAPDQSPTKPFLREVLLSESHVASTGLPGKTCGESYGGAPTVALGAHEEKQPNAQKGGERQAESYSESHGPQAPGAWGQRDGTDKARASFNIKTWAKYFIRVCGPDKKEKGGGVPDLLQNRPSVSRYKAWHRVRRAITQAFKSASSGQEKGQISKIKRLGHSEIQKLGYIDKFGECYFYDLSVERHPSYSVGGYLVHNCHRFKSLKAKRTKALFQKYVSKFDRVVFMSGTPMPNRPFELYPILHFAAPAIIDFADSHEYALKYCAAFQCEFGRWNYDGASHVDDLFSKMRASFMLRIKKQDVLKDLPDKVEELLILDAKEPTKCELMSQKIIREHQAENISLLVGDTHVATYRRELGEHKAPIVAKIVREYLEGSGESILLFAHHKSVVAALTEALSDFSPIVITGDVPTKDREALVQSFQTGSSRLVIGNIDACGVGFTMTKATRVIFCESSWAPASNSQAADRSHRIGQKESVFVQHCIIPNTLDANILMSVMRKTETINKL